MWARYLSSEILKSGSGRRPIVRNAITRGAITRVPCGPAESKTLANLYLHYVLELWVNQWRRKEATGDVIIVRYADDAVLGFQHRYEAERFLEQLRERLGKFGLELNSEKTRLIEFGRYAAERRKKRGQGKPETFNFLGFSHICGTSYRAGSDRKSTRLNSSHEFVSRMPSSA